MRLRNLLYGLILIAGSASATPALQLDIYAPGTFYDTGSESVMTSDDVFTLYAYGNTVNGNGNPAKLDLEHFISIAIVPKGTTAGTNIGTFKFDGTEYSSSDLTYGNPPLDVAAKNSDLQSHDIFDTLYLEIGFYFDPNVTRTDVNTQDNPGTDPLTNPGDANDGTNDIAYVGFDVDTRYLAPGYELHFDLYNTNVKKGELVTGDFAPFSHDAGTTGDKPPFIRIPEPNILAIFSLGLVLIGSFLRGRKKH